MLKRCFAAKLKILNGQARRDLQGHFTCFGLQGYSTVDLVLGSESCLKSSQIQYLSVQDLNLLSDHKPIPFKISNNSFFQTNKNPSNYISEDRPRKYYWNSSLKKSYEKHLADKTTHIVRHYENVSSDCRSNKILLLKT